MLNSDKIILWVSWWPDSMYLAYLLEKNLWKKKLIIAHFNHKFRKESDKEEIFLKNYFTKKWINFICKSYKWNDFREHVLRKERYNFFKEVWWWKNFLALWHNLTDRIETTFINVVRWTWLKWFLNMKKLDKNRKIYRPLLHLTKKEIQIKCEEFNIPYFIDKTNFYNSFSKRNYIRNNILPLFEKLWNNFYKSFDKIYCQVEQILPSFNILNYISKVEDDIYKLYLPKCNINFFIRDLLDFFGIYDFRSWVIEEIINYIKVSKWWGFKKYWNLFIFKKKWNIYIWKNLSIEKIKQIWQKINKN